MAISGTMTLIRWWEIKAWTCKIIICENPHSPHYSPFKKIISSPKLPSQYFKARIILHTKIMSHEINKSKYHKQILTNKQNNDHIYENTGVLHQLWWYHRIILKSLNIGISTVFYARKCLMKSFYLYFTWK